MSAVVTEAKITVSSVGLEYSWTRPLLLRVGDGFSEFSVWLTLAQARTLVDEMQRELRKFESNEGEAA